MSQTKTADSPKSDQGRKTKQIEDSQAQEKLFQNWRVKYKDNVVSQSEIYETEQEGVRQKMRRREDQKQS